VCREGDLVDDPGRYLAYRCGITPREAREYLGVSDALQELPVTRAAFARGELTFSKVRALTRVATAASEVGFVELAGVLTASQLQRALRAFQRLSADDAARSHEVEFVSYRFEEDGSLYLRARLPAEDGTLLVKALDAAALTTDGAGRCDLDDGPVVSPETARRLGCDAELVTRIERAGLPVSVGRRRRTVPPALRRLLEARDRETCCFPGCERNRRLQAHHRQHWAHGGETSLAGQRGRVDRRQPSSRHPRGTGHQPQRLRRPDGPRCRRRRHDLRRRVRRLQVLLDETQYARLLTAYAAERRISVGAAVRKAIDRAVPSTTRERELAARRILAATPMAVPDPEGLRRELGELAGLDVAALA
jgi:hypothetical protein